MYRYIKLKSRMFQSCMDRKRFLYIWNKLLLSSKSAVKFFSSDSGIARKMNPNRNKFLVWLVIRLTFCSLKARLYRRFLSRQLDVICFGLKLQLQNDTWKPGAVFSAICRRDIAGVSNMFEAWCNFSATKIAWSCRDKNRKCKLAFRQY